MARPSVHSPAAVETARQERRRRLGDTIREWRNDLNQSELGVRLAPLTPDGRPVPQTTISRWEKGMVELTLEQVHDLEEALGRRHGSLSAAGGYVAPTPDQAAIDIAELLMADSSIDPIFHKEVVSMIKSFRKASEALQVRKATSEGRRTATGR